MQQGFIGLHRKLMDNPVWADPNYLKLWIYCLFKASHKAHDQLIGNQIVKLERGQFITGRFSLSEDFNKGVKPKQRVNDLTLWRYLNNLEKFEMLNIKTTNKYSVVTIVNYDVYQVIGTKDEQQSEHQMNNKRTTNEQQMNTNNNVNNVKNEISNKTLSHKFEICDLESAKLLFSLMQKNNPEVKKPNIEKWADDMRKIRELDKRTTKQINWLIDWCQKDNFWSSNILSPAKLRKQWDTLVLRAKNEHEKKQQLAIGAHTKQNKIDFDKLREELGDE